MDKNLLKAEIVRQGLTIGQLAQAIGVKETALYSRMSKNSSKPFTLDLASKISVYLKLSPEKVYEIFIGSESDLKQ